MLSVDVQYAVEGEDLPALAQLVAWAQAAWRDPDADAEAVIRVADEVESHRLNLEYRGKDNPTNVLSFPYEPLPELDLHHVGDVVICAAVVRREAAEQHKSSEAHWAHMVVHGMLHLQGYDHENADDARLMETLETRILAGLGYPAPYDDEAR
jgi:probable rRNA maturation factor